MAQHWIRVDRILWRKWTENLI